jgi:hypothetical protein
MPIRPEDNPKPFVKGQSGNPAGRPKGTRNRSTIVREWMEAIERTKNPITGETEELSQADIATLAVLKKARSGDVNAYRELMDSAFGKVPDRVIDETNQQRKLVIVTTDKDIE